MSSSPTCQSPDFRNWTTATFHSRAMARIMMPNAAVDLPFPSPVLTTTTERAARAPSGRWCSAGGSSVVTSASRRNFGAMAVLRVRSDEKRLRRAALIVAIGALLTGCAAGGYDAGAARRHLVDAGVGPERPTAWCWAWVASVTNSSVCTPRPRAPSGKRCASCWRHATRSTGAESARRSGGPEVEAPVVTDAARSSGTADAARVPRLRASRRHPTRGR